MEELVTSGQMGQTTLCKGVARGKVYTKRSTQQGVSRKNISRKETSNQFSASHLQENY